MDKYNLIRYQVQDIQCSAYYACRAAKIFTSNVQSFTATMSGVASFVSGWLYSSNTDIGIHVQCGPSSGACEGAGFYYLNQGQSTHSCDGVSVCRRSMIRAVSAVALVCKESRSCYKTSLILPSDEQLNQQSSLTVYSRYSPLPATMKVYSLYTFTNFISVNGTALDAIHFVYGMRFNQYCVVSDASCMNAVPSNIGSYDELTIIDTYQDGIPSQSLVYTGDVLIFASMQYRTFTPPSIPDTNTLSILCLFCERVTFQLSGVQNAVLSDGSANLMHSNVTGSTGYFELNIMHWSNHNKYLLQNTSTIVIHSFGDHTDLYLGNAVDVEIHCPLESSSLYWSCTSANIWSTLQRADLHLAKGTPGYWDLNTEYEFLIQFDFEEYACTYVHYVSNCSFMTFNPTGATMQPTKNPSRNPSQQTGHPSSVPTYNPSQPSSHPLHPPTKTTHAPSNQPSKPAYDINEGRVDEMTTNYPQLSELQDEKQPDTDGLNVFAQWVMIIGGVIGLCAIICVSVFIGKRFVKAKIKNAFSVGRVQGMFEQAAPNNVEEWHDDSNNSEGDGDIIRDVNTLGANMGMKEDMADVVTPGIDEFVVQGDDITEGCHGILETHYQKQIKQYSTCSQCGDRTQEKTARMNSILVCSTCRRLDREDVDKEVDQMFDSNKNTQNDTRTKGKTLQSVDCGEDELSDMAAMSYE
eukprot:533413_1